jgi:hypothetical protein
MKAISCLIGIEYQFIKSGKNKNNNPAKKQNKLDKIFLERK